MEKEKIMANVYLSCKVVKALPEKNQNGEDGYRIFYPDGYVSWCPKGTFESSYRNIDEFANDMSERGVSDIFAACYLQDDDPRLMKPAETVEMKRFDLTLDF